MIKTIRGALIAVGPETAIIEAGGLGYEVQVPQTTAERLVGLEPGSEVSLHTYHYLAMDHSRGLPMLLGFDSETQRELFTRLLEVPRVGPKMACRMLAAPVSSIARAIELGDTGFLKSLPGVGASKARDISNALRGKLTEFAGVEEIEPAEPEPGEHPAGMKSDATEVLTQLGFSASDARAMVKAALQRRPGISTADQLIAEALAEKA